MHYEYKSYNDNLSEVPYLFIGIIMILSVVMMGFKAISHDLEKVTQTVEIVNKVNEKVVFKLTTSSYDKEFVIFGDKEFIKAQKCIQYKKMIQFRNSKHIKDSISNKLWMDEQKDLQALQEIKCK